MNTERRYSARHPITLMVQILYGKRRFYGARVGNLSSQGMLLTLHNLTLPIGTMVELELACLGREWLIGAVVAHRSGFTVGLMFREPQPALYQGLLQGPLCGHPALADPTPRPQAPSERPRLARH